MDRNDLSRFRYGGCRRVALRKESVDRNVDPDKDSLTDDVVALRKESVDRNALGGLGGAAPQGRSP